MRFDLQMATFRSVMKSLCLCSCLVVSDPVRACGVFEKPSFADALLADAVLIASVTRYEHDTPGQAKLTLQPIEILSGDIEPHLEPDGSLSILWNNQPFGLPESDPQRQIIRRSRYVIGVNFGAKPGFMESARDDTPKTFPIILQRSCSVPFVFAAQHGVGIILHQVFGAAEKDRKTVLSELWDFAEQTGVDIVKDPSFPFGHWPPEGTGLRWSE